MTHRGYSARYSRLLLLVLVAALLLAGCTAAAMPDDSPDPVISEAASRRVVQRVVAIGESTASGQTFTATATQDEVTSFLALGAAVLSHYQAAHAAGIDAEPRQIPGIDEVMSDDQWQQAMTALFERPTSAGALLLRLHGYVIDPRVHFKQDGTLVLRGTAIALGTRVPVRAVFAPYQTPSGYSLRLMDIRAGSIRAPEWAFALLQDGIDQGLALASQSVTIQQIAITQAEISISGVMR